MLKACCSDSLPASDPRSGSDVSASQMQLASIAPRDLATLASQVVEGLRAQLMGDVLSGFERLLQEQERRLLAVLVAEPGSGRLGGMTDYDGIVLSMSKEPTPALNQGPQDNITPRKCKVKASLQGLGSSKPLAVPSGMMSLEGAECSKLGTAVQQVQEGASAVISWATDQSLRASLPPVRAHPDIKLSSLKWPQLADSSVPSHALGDVTHVGTESSMRISGQVRGQEASDVQAAAGLHIDSQATPVAGGETAGLPGMVRVDLGQKQSSEVPAAAADAAADGDSFCSTCECCVQSRDSSNSTQAASAGTSPEPKAQQLNLAQVAVKAIPGLRRRSSVSTCSSLEEISEDHEKTPKVHHVQSSASSCWSGSPSLQSLFQSQRALLASDVQEQNSELERPGRHKTLSTRVFSSDSKVLRLMPEEHWDRVPEQKRTLGRPGFPGAVDHRAFASDTRVAGLKRREEGATTSERHRESAQRGVRRTLSAKPFASDIKSGGLKRREGRAMTSEGRQGRAAASECSGQPAKLGLPRALDAKAFASDTKAVRHKRKEEWAVPFEQSGELLRKGMRRTPSAKAFTADTTGLGFKCKEERTTKSDGEQGKPRSHAKPDTKLYASDTKIAAPKLDDDIISGISWQFSKVFEQGPALEPKPDRNRTFDNMSFSSCSTTQQAAPRSEETTASWLVGQGLRRLARLDPKAYSSDTNALRLKREEELLGLRCHHEDPARPGPHRALNPIPSASDAQGRPKWLEELVDELRSKSDTKSTSGTEPFTARSSSKKNLPVPGAHLGKRLYAPLLLRLCGILPWNPCRDLYYRWLALAPLGLVAIFAMQLYQAQLHIGDLGDCPLALCVHFGYLSDLVLAVGGSLGFLAMRRLNSQELLGNPACVLWRYAVEQEVVLKWHCTCWWQSLCVAVLWVGNLVCRTLFILPDPSLQEVIQFCTVVLTNLILIGLIFGNLHMQGLCCILIDSYAVKVSQTKDLDIGVRQWDRLGSLLRKVSRALNRSFVIIHITMVTALLCSLSDLMLQGEQHFWWFISNVVLGQGLVVLLAKGSEVTEMCSRVPPLINSMDFESDNFILEKHYLVEHINYSAAGFYVGEVRVTAALVLRLYAGILTFFGAAVGALTRLTAD